MSTFVKTAWRKSSRSGGEHGNCVEVANVRGLVGVRDSKLPQAGHLALSSQAFKGFIQAIKAGDLDLS